MNGVGRVTVESGRGPLPIKVCRWCWHTPAVAFIGYGKSARFDVLNRRYHAMMENSCRKDWADFRPPCPCDST
jgi:hypothetical protein